MLLPEKYESIFDVSSEGPSSGSLPFHIFQVEAYLTYCEDIYKVSTYTGSCCSYFSIAISFPVLKKNIKNVCNFVSKLFVKMLCL